MLGVLNRIDEFILRRVEIIAHAVQRFCGITNYALAWLCTGLYASTIALCILDYFTPNFLKSITTTAFGVAAHIVFIVIWIIPAMRELERADKHIQEGSADAASRPATKKVDIMNGSSIWRLFWLCFAIQSMALVALQAYGRKVGILDVFVRLGDSFFAAILYLVLVTPLPPSCSKVRKWLSSLFGWREPAFATSSAE